MRKLVLTCRSLEAQLQQSIPKKTHQEIVAKMQGAIDSLSADLGRTREDLAKTTSLGERINALESTVVSQSSMISSQNNVIGALTSKFSEALVLASTYAEATARIQSLEERVGSMVERSQYDALVDANHEFEERLANSVPKEEYYSLKERIDNTVSKSVYDELEYKFSQMVPREELAIAESKVQDLERALLNSVPRQDFEELASKMAQLSSAADAARVSAQETLQVAPTEVAIQPTPEVAEVPTISAMPEESYPAASPTTGVPVGEPAIESIVTSEGEPVQTVDVPTLASPVPDSPQPESTISSAIEFASPAPEVNVTPISSEPAPVQEILVSIDQTETVVTSQPIEESEPIVESIASDQGTLDGTTIDILPAIEPTTPASPVDNSAGQTTLLDTSRAPETAGATPEDTPQAVVADSPAPETFVETPSIAEETPPQSVDVSEPTVSQVEPAPETTFESKSEPSQVITEIQAAEFVASPQVETYSAPQNAEIREVQSQLAEINAAAETGETSLSPAPEVVVVEYEKGFKFSNSEFCARSGLEFMEDLEKVDATVVELHCRNGDFERWFKEVLADESSVESIRSVRESNLSGDEMRAQLVTVIAQRYRK